MANYSNFIINQKVLYKKIGHIVCPALGGERVYFNNRGFNHLLRKLGKLRSYREQVQRLSLMKHIKSIIENPRVDVTGKIDSSRTLPVTFWCLSTTFGTKKIKIIVRRIGVGKIHFFSIFLIR